MSLGKSGSRFTHPEVIDKKEAKNLWRYFTEGSITLMLWVLWVYWFLPIVTLALWFFGVRIFYQTIFYEVTVTELFKVLRNGMTVICAIFIIQIIWIYHNYNIFRRRGERRKIVTLSLDKDIAECFNIDLALLEKAKQASRIEVTFKQDNKLIVNKYS